MGLKVVPVGVAERGAWNYAFVYELFQRWYPEIPEQARAIKRGQARRVLVQRYLDNVVAADRKMVGKVFHVLRWTKRELERTIEALVEAGAVREAQIEGVDHPQLLSTHVLATRLWGCRVSQQIQAQVPVYDQSDRPGCRSREVT